SLVMVSLRAAFGDPSEPQYTRPVPPVHLRRGETPSSLPGEDPTARLPPCPRTEQERSRSARRESRSSFGSGRPPRATYFAPYLGSPTPRLNDLPDPPPAERRGIRGPSLCCRPLRGWSAGLAPERRSTRPPRRRASTSDPRSATRASASGCPARDPS